MREFWRVYLTQLPAALKPDPARLGGPESPSVPHLCAQLTFLTPPLGPVSSGPPQPPASPRTLKAARCLQGVTLHAAKPRSRAEHLRLRGCQGSVETMCPHTPGVHTSPGTRFHRWDVLPSVGPKRGRIDHEPWKVVFLFFVLPDRWTERAGASFLPWPLSTKLVMVLASPASCRALRFRSPLERDQ